MSAISASLVKELRELTGLPMMECKTALTETSGDFEAAKEWLKKKHKGKLQEREGRETGEGRIGVWVSSDGKRGGIVELRCETAPVAKNGLFIELANGFAEHVAHGKEAAPDSTAVRADPKMDARFVEVYGQLRETMNVGSCYRLAGEYITYYVHHDGKTGVMIALSAKPRQESAATDLCMHAAFAQPVAITAEEVSKDLVDKIRAEAREQAIAEGKPAGVVDKIAEGRVKAFFGERVLMEQLHARSDVYGKKTVREVLKEAGVNAVTGYRLLKIR